MKQGLFEVFGEGHLGLKADDLNRFSQMIIGSGMVIPEGIVIATGIFDQLVNSSGLHEEIRSEEIEKQDCPAFLASINESILNILEKGKPYAIRSSALSERGGIGIYKSTFFQPNGNPASDLQELWHCESVVYASEFTPDAMLWRKKSKGPLGMAILIQPVVGFYFEEFFLPPLSGVAYTSYNGLSTVRVVLGLGTKAVNGGGEIYNYPSDHVLHFQREMWDQEEADAFTANGVTTVHTHFPEIHGEIAQGFDSFNRLFSALAELKKLGNFYLEWAILRDQLFVVQCAAYEDKLPGDSSFDSDGYFLLFKGKDVFHSGRSTCKGIVYVDDWSPKTIRALESLNQEIKDYLLIVPQDALSWLAGTEDEGKRLNFRHFSNALAVVEKQRAYTENQKDMFLQMGRFRADHSSGVGATHFSQLCDRTNILFVGGIFDATPLFALSGGTDYRKDVGVMIYNTPAEVVINSEEHEGYVYISKEKAEDKKYFLSQLTDWTYVLRSVANRFDESGNKEMANHFYAIHYAIAPIGNPFDFDPFKLDETVISDFGGKKQFVDSLEAVITNGGHLVDAEMRNDGLKDYLDSLLSKLKQ